MDELTEISEADNNNIKTSEKLLSIIFALFIGVVFDKIIALGKEDGFVTGTPYVEGAKVTARAIKNGKGKKIMVFKYKAKKNYRKRQGHRQPYTKVEIQTIVA